MSFGPRSGCTCTWGAQGMCVGTQQHWTDTSDKMGETNADESKLCLESRWLGPSHLQCYSLICSETRTGKIPLRNPESWPWLASLNMQQQNTAGFSLNGVDRNSLERWKPSAVNH